MYRIAIVTDSEKSDGYADRLYDFVKEMHVSGNRDLWRWKVYSKI